MQNIIFTVLLLTIFSVAFAQSGDFHLDQEYKINKSGVVDLSCSDAKVFITGSRRATAHVKIDRQVTAKGWSVGGEDFRVEVTENEGNLRIKEAQVSSYVTMVGYYKEDYKIEIEVPDGVSLTVRGDDGDYFIKNINGSIFLSLDDADAELSDCNGDKFRFRMDDGDIRMNKGKGRLEIDADDADIEIYDAQFSSIDADMDDGDLRIETALANNGSYRINSQDGLIALNITSGGGEFDIRHDDGSITMQGDFKTAEESEDHIRTLLGNGSAKVTVRADDARVKLTTGR